MLPYLDREVDLLTRWYHISREGAAELIAEMRDTKSLYLRRFGDFE